MIKNIELKNIATFEDAAFQPTVLNFIFGSNGTGKTTISEQIRMNRGLTITGDKSELDFLVYNRRFKEDNFRASSNLKGVFTLGEDSVEKMDQISNLDYTISQLNSSIEKIKISLNYKSDLLSELDDSFVKECWDIEQVLKSEFSSALTGYKSDRKKFSKKCLDVFESKDSFIEPTNLEEYLNDLKTRYRSLYSANITEDALLERLEIDDSKLEDAKSSLSEVIVGSDNNQISEFIEFLGNSRWMRDGLKYLEILDNKCPYCQQPLQPKFLDDLKNYFDDGYLKRVDSLNLIHSYYEDLLNSLKSLRDVFDETELEYMNLSKARKLARDAFDSVSECLEIIDKKIQDPALVFYINPPIGIINKLNEEINLINIEINKHNRSVENLQAEKSTFIEDFWHYIVSMLKDKIEKYLKASNGHNKGIQNLKSERNTKNTLLEQKKAEKSDLVRSLSSTKRTIEDINSILREFGYTSFKLSESKEEPNSYVIIRENGEDAKQSLSEGEFTFITFLYFYHLCYGMENESAQDRDKIVVIDDPISSLDSNILFIVSMLTKNILKDAEGQNNHIAQAIILTHNLYFHKEVSFYGSRGSWPANKTKYFIVKKINNISRIEEYNNNPISTTYEILWRQVATNESPDLALNAMRRILEHYFNLIGGYNYERLINDLNGTDKVICKSLVAYINDGSHSIFDCLDYAIDSDNIKTYSNVFRKIFQIMGQESHYEMMINKFKPQTN